MREMVEKWLKKMFFFLSSHLITDGCVSLVGEKEEVPVKILRDTEAMD